MSVWLYQINQKLWPPNRYRMEIWEGQTWSWPVGRMQGKGETIQTGDIVAFFYAPSGGANPGFYGWAIIQEYIDTDPPHILFRPVSPSDYLKMSPWWNEEAKSLADRIRGNFKQITLWRIPQEEWANLNQGIRRWFANATK